MIDLSDLPVVWPRPGWDVVPDDQIPERFAGGRRVAGYLARARLRAAGVSP